MASSTVAVEELADRLEHPAWEAKLLPWKRFLHLHRADVLTLFAIVRVSL